MQRCMAFIAIMRQHPARADTHTCSTVSMGCRACSSGSRSSMLAWPRDSPAGRSILVNATHSGLPCSKGAAPLAASGVRQHTHCGSSLGASQARQACSLPARHPPPPTRPLPECLGGSPGHAAGPRWAPCRPGRSSRRSAAQPHTLKSTWATAAASARPPPCATWHGWATACRDFKAAACGWLHPT